MRNNKGFSAINILGLATGLAVALIIGLWAYHEASYDIQVPDKERIFQVRRNFNSNGEILNFTSVSLKLGATLKSEMPEIEYIAETDWMGPHNLKAGEQKLVLEGAHVADDFLHIFQYPFIQGDVNSAFKDPYSIILTASAARALFGNADPMGKIVRIDNTDNLTVTGILKDLPENSSFRFKYLMTMRRMEQAYDFVKEARKSGFGDNSFQLFAKVRAGVDPVQFAAKIKNIEKSETTSTNAMNSEVILQPLERWHLYRKYVNGKDSGGLIDNVRTATIVGILVLLIACINFINLSTARSSKRAKEVGIRKAVGAERKFLIFQFLVESFLTTLIAAVIACILAALALPLFNRMAGITVKIPYNTPMLYVILLSAIVIVSLIAGARPAFILSSFRPVKILKGIRIGKSSSNSRRALVIAQFTCSIALIIATIVIHNQVDYARNRSVGYDKGLLLQAALPGEVGAHFDAFRNQLMQSGVVTNVTAASSPITAIFSHNDLEAFPGKLPGETVEMANFFVYNHYFQTAGMKVVAGRDFREAAADSLSVILNEAAVKRLRLKDPVNQTITWADRKLVIVGVVRDALMESPYANPEPSMFVPLASEKSYGIFRLAGNVDPHTAVAAIEKAFMAFSPESAFAYKFTDDEYNTKFRQEVLIGRLSTIFTVLAIFISCLGLLGLAAFTAEQRTKEIGIRKALGASVTQIWAMLSKDFVMLVMASALLASPLAFYFVQRWLQQFDYRVDISVSVFVIAALGALLVTLFTISYQAIKAALMDPVKSLRSE
ncbi:MacB-like core domain-containing protein [Chitinophaga jiangningensis]|uniref:MacB-like core domain-containing protein n=2 Tax=Chitinophaga jiangningensis TaxID=1419482 RepID=A0A1M7MGY3_9BACT|nr:MacB-like core domain-containing protein [Chitinophaga jiangningensis]